MPIISSEIGPIEARHPLFFVSTNLTALVEGEKELRSRVIPDGSTMTQLFLVPDPVNSISIVFPIFTT